MEEPFGIHPWTNGNHCVPLSQMARELDYRLIKELWAFTDVLPYASPTSGVNDSGHWYRSYGNEAWKFNEDGLMATRLASINDLPISESDRKYHWPLGRRPDNPQALSDLGL
jgi:nuclear transport factor 2 (NTF2) superfamily protein